MRHAREPAYSTLNNQVNNIVRLRTVAAPRIAFVIFAFVGLSACEQNSFVPPPPPKVDVGIAGSARHHALSRGHRQHRADQECRSGRARAGRAAIDQLPGRHLREGGHHAVHDRARNLQAEARAGPGRRGRRAGVAEAGRGRLQASVRPGAAAGGLAGDARYLHLRARQRPGQSAAGPGQHQDRGGQLRLYQCRRAVRRHRQRPSGLGRRTGRRGVADAAWRPSWRSIRST